ncbi:MAG: type 4a pilus biogenesis protein PilO [Candidatus Omnitrophota bacterium]
MKVNVNDLIKKIPIKNNKVLILIVLVSVVIFYLDYSFVLRLQLQSINKINSNIVNKKKNVGTLHKELAEVQDLKAKRLSQGKEPVRIKKFISEERMPSLLKEISDIANKNQVRINQIKPSKGLAQDSKQLKLEKFFCVLIALDLTAEYHKAGSFLNDLEENETYFSVEEIKITPNANDLFHQGVKLVLKTNVKP